MPEPNDFELFSGPAPSEKSEKNDEKFRDEMRQGQIALQQLQQEEGQAKAHDNSLAGIIVQFLSQPGNTDLFLLISRVVAQNIPSELIIAVLALIDKASQEEIKGLLAAGAQTESDATSLAVYQKASLNALAPEHKKALDVWIRNISQVAHKKPHRVLEALVIPGPQRRLSSMIVQLSAFILRNYLAQSSITIDFQDLRDFMQGVFVQLVKDLENTIKTQQKLTA